MQYLSTLSFRWLRHMAGAMLALGLLGNAFAADDSPEAFIKRLSGDVIEAIKTDRKSTRLNSSHSQQSRMPSSA